MDYIKEAFQKVKEDITNLNYELSSIKEELNEIQNSLLHIFSLVSSTTDTSTHLSTEKASNSTLRQMNKTDNISINTI